MCGQKQKNEIFRDSQGVRCKEKIEIFNYCIEQSVFGFSVLGLSARSLGMSLVESSLRLLPPPDDPRPEVTGLVRRSEPEDSGEESADDGADGDDDDDDEDAIDRGLFCALDAAD